MGVPGGKVDDDDRQPGDDEAGAARRAAAREAMEECGLAVDPDDLVAFSHWVPPAITPRRFSTHFFLARPATVRSPWTAVRSTSTSGWRAEVLDRRDRGEVDLAPPTWVTLHELAEHDTVDDALRAAAARDPIPHYETRWVTIDGGAVAMWAGRRRLREQRSGPARARHRLWMLADGWRLERS